jgi:hypothetical protein
MEICSSTKPNITVIRLSQNTGSKYQQYDTGFDIHVSVHHGTIYKNDQQDATV